MRSLFILQLAFRSLRRAPARSALTTLGVIVGVAALITTTSLGSAADLRIREALSKPETRTIYLTARIPQGQTFGYGGKLPRSERLSVEDYDLLRLGVPMASNISPRIFVETRAFADGKSRDITLEGIDVGGFNTTQHELVRGSPFGHLDVRHAEPVCLVSASLASELWPHNPIPGRSLRLGNVWFTSIGVVADMAVGVPDLHVYIPFTSLLYRIDPNAEMSIAVQSRDVEQVNETLRRVRDLMEQNRHGRRVDFRITSALTAIEAYAESSATMIRLLTAVAVVSLVIGGIGILNIMLVSVAERTREIGIRIAVGTREADIRRQFLSEAIALCVTGGLSGIAIGIATSVLVTKLYDWSPIFTPGSIAGAFVCSVAVGILFGYQPARRAAQLNPVDALRPD